VNTSLPGDPVNTQPTTGLPELLLSELRQRPGLAALRFSAPPERLSGGFWAEIFILHLTDPSGQLPTDVVARIAPDPALAQWETTVQSGVAEQGFPTPAVHCSGGPNGAVGRSWSVMDLARGEPLLAGLSGVGALVRLPRLARQLPDRLASIAARLHRLDARPVRSELEHVTGEPVGIDRFVEHLTDRAHDLGDDCLIAATDHLVRARPEATAEVICHGDLHPFNVLVDHGELTLLDWTAAQVADPTYDLAFTSLLLSMAPLDAPAALQPIIGSAARQVSRRFLGGYEHHTGRRIDQQQLGWHTTLHATRILTELEGWTASQTAHLHQDHPWRTIAPSVRQLLDTTVYG
jgi:aminoglycoside phosphotransferase (APT) family kinase protein